MPKRANAQAAAPGGGKGSGGALRWGRTFSDDAWRVRHRTLSTLLRAHAAVIAVLPW